MACLLKRSTKMNNVDEITRAQRKLAGVCIDCGDEEQAGDQMDDSGNNGQWRYYCSRCYYKYNRSQTWMEAYDNWILDKKQECHTHQREKWIGSIRPGRR